MRNGSILLLTALTLLGRVFYQTRGADTFSWSGSYEAVAHVWVGVLIGLWIAGSKPARACAIAVTLAEIVAFMFWK